MSNETSSATPVSDQLRATGNWNPAWDAIAQLDPIWAEKFMAMGMHPVISGVLEPKVFEFLAIAVDASCTHMYAPGTRRHIRKAIELGATQQEIAAVLQAVSVLGIHSSSLGAPILLEELAAFEKAQGEGAQAAA
ncbi:MULTISPECIES: carboxymuconolactone decarboxylase family protein [unclassified Paraburkholderia]|uniref:carboxymuconolactone decarboxylase family protein n=1 Tax=unclassified Paraburkholderia TaxID=2615204 RepID=UPI001610920D|nr:MULTISPECIES: carboxymuconolactone decarboxylase family protein [unclassified Paraburkholderia]MBB5444913.1 alkylhydroperoxidase/carboxymuconolactone decarboxylase family protein YurZ [Paraburkholderia sp. WSM4177]MBB5483845.1 alkylhydroperoxidase/carboxymuconolactone decarboxylase family protein YurZ [Paraburkholderia sp. WSM4180]